MQAHMHAVLNLTCMRVRVGLSHVVDNGICTCASAPGDVAVLAVSWPKNRDGSAVLPSLGVDGIKCQPVALAPETFVDETMVATNCMWFQVFRGRTSWRM